MHHKVTNMNDGNSGIEINTNDELEFTDEQLKEFDAETMKDLDELFRSQSAKEGRRTTIFDDDDGDDNNVDDSEGF